MYSKEDQAIDRLRSDKESNGSIDIGPRFEDSLELIRELQLVLLRKRPIQPTIGNLSSRCP